MKAYKAVLYDLDGTLLNTINMNLYPLLRIIQEELGEVWALEDVMKYMAYPGMKTLEELNIPDRDKVYARWVRYVNEYEEGATPYEGVPELVETLHRHGIRQAAVSSKQRAQYRIDMGPSGLVQYMETAVLEEDTIRHKPHPDPLLECLRRMALTPKEVMYIGDTRSDSLAAKAAGIDFGYARWGSVEQQEVEYAACVLERPTDLLDVIKL